MTPTTFRLPRSAFALVLPLALAVPSWAVAQAPKTAVVVNIATDATDPSNLGDTEPSIAVNPRNPLEIAVRAMSSGHSACVS